MRIAQTRATVDGAEDPRPRRANTKHSHYSSCVFFFLFYSKCGQIGTFNQIFGHEKNIVVTDKETRKKILTNDWKRAAA